MEFSIKTAQSEYTIRIIPGGIRQAGQFFDLDRKVLIVTDSGVPEQYAEAVAKQCKHPVTVRILQGEESKNVENWQKLLGIMLQNNFTRSDCVVAVGGGVVGDLSGFCASAFMRGVDFYNIPTTLLSQIDSSIGGKTAIDFGGVKNSVGAFYPPREVIIDTELLKTLPDAHIANGLAEAVKMALTSDAELFGLIANNDISENMQTVIERSLMIKKYVVEQDERESGLRRILNFGHTIGHGIESVSGLYHGQCVALGMLPMCSPGVRAKLIPVLEKLGLPTSYKGDIEKIYEKITHDKKTDGTGVTVVTVWEPGSCALEKITLEDLKNRLSYFG